tara:strand:- start:303 stop:674 length:372 start_codon:yes stop_codon:yes gene_type:complete
LTSCFFLFADVCVLLITEGLANLALVGGSVTVFKAKVEKAMPRKSGAAAMGYGKALGTFHKNVMAALESKVDFEKVRVYFHLREFVFISDIWATCLTTCFVVLCTHRSSVLWSRGRASRKIRS